MTTGPEFLAKLDKLTPEEVRLNIAGTYFGAERELAKGWLDNFSSREQSRTARSAKNAAWIAAIAAIIAAISAVVAMYPILHEWWKATTH